MSNLICYGDIVYIEFDNLILIANDSYNPLLYLASRDNIARKSFKNGLFRLYPNFSYKDSQQVEKLEDQLQLLKSLNPSEELAAKQLENDIRNERRILEERENRLEDLNKKMYAEAKGQPIIYGHKVQLLHVESQCFVSLSDKLNKEGNIINLELSKEGSKKLYFKFMPKLVFNQEGQAIEYDAPVKLISCKSDTFLTKGSEVDLTKIQIGQTPDLDRNTFCNNDGDFAQILPRRKEPVYQAEKLFQTGMSLKEVPENMYLRKFISSKDDDKSHTMKTLKNGDYVRISNDKYFLHMFLQRKDSSIQKCFQCYKGDFDYNYNNIVTLFQIQEVSDVQINDDGTSNQNQYDPSKLPEGNILEPNENKRYTLRHVVSGNYLVCKDGAITLLNSKDAKGEEKITLVRRGTVSTSSNHIDRNSIFQFKFYSEEKKEERFLSIGTAISLPHVQNEMNSTYFVGFFNPQNYLNKLTRPERFIVDANTIADEQFSSFKLLKASNDEMTSIFMVESLTNHLQILYDQFSLLIKDEAVKQNTPVQEAPKD